MDVWRTWLIGFILVSMGSIICGAGALEPVTYGMVLIGLVIAVLGGFIVGFGSGVYSHATA